MSRPQIPRVEGKMLDDPRRDQYGEWLGLVVSRRCCHEDTNFVVTDACWSYVFPAGLAELNLFGEGWRGQERDRSHHPVRRRCNDGGDLHSPAEDPTHKPHERPRLTKPFPYLRPHLALCF